MKHQRHYSTISKQRIAIFLISLVVVGLAVGYLAGWLICSAVADETATCWVICKPGAQVMIRKSASKDSRDLGFLEAGDDFRTDGKTRNGFIHALGVGDSGEGWIYSGFVATEEPEAVFETYCCVAKTRVACRRWCGGPQISGRSGWLYNGTDVTVFYIADGWAVTSRGYIRSEWLEADPQ